MITDKELMEGILDWIVTNAKSSLLENRYDLECNCQGDVIRKETVDWLEWLEEELTYHTNAQEVMVDMLMKDETCRKMFEDAAKEAEE